MDSILIYVFGIVTGILLSLIFFMYLGAKYSEKKRGKHDGKWNEENF